MFGSTTRGRKTGWPTRVSGLSFSRSPVTPDLLVTGFPRPLRTPGPDSRFQELSA
jgi:hypothetical protein